MTDAARQTTIQKALRAAVDADQEACGISPNDLDAAHDAPRVAAVVAAFLRSAADTHAGCFGTMEPREALKFLAAEVEAVHAR